MRFLKIFILLLGINNLTFGQSKKLVIIGNVPTPMPNYNADTLFKILEKIKPDIILLEIDSDYFTEDFHFKNSSNENEQTATTKYIDKYPFVKARPFEFEGRNNYRKEKGIKQSEEKTMNLLDSLYSNNKLLKKQSSIVKKYYSLSDTLNSFGLKSVLDFNNFKIDSIAKIRQFYQHYLIRQVINQRNEFSNQFVLTSLREKITLKEGYNRLCDFWDLRNKTMSKNIINVLEENSNKKVVVLTGYNHRYYLIEEINKVKKEKNIKLIEFYNE